MPRGSKRCAALSCFAFSAFVDRVICHKYITFYDDNQRQVMISNQLLRGQIESYLLCTGSDQFALWRTLVTGTKRPILQHPGLEESINDPQQPWIPNAVSEKTLKVIVRNLVKETFDV